VRELLCEASCCSLRYHHLGKVAWKEVHFLWAHVMAMTPPIFGVTHHANFNDSVLDQRRVHIPVVKSKDIVLVEPWKIIIHCEIVFVVLQVNIKDRSQHFGKHVLPHEIG